MPSLSMDPKEWCAEYRNATPEDQHQLILQTISQPLSEEFLDGLDLAEFLIDHLHMLDRHDQNKELISLIERLQDEQPDLYLKEFYYFDQYLLNYYLYLDQPEELAGSLSRFAADPASSIDYMLQALDLLKLYQKTDMVVELCESAYQAVKDSDKVLPGCEEQLGDTVYYYLIEQLYRQLQAGRPIDWTAFAVHLAKFGFTDALQMQTNLSQYLSSEVSGPDGFLGLLQQSGPQGYWLLAYDFYKYMHDRKRVGFVCSNLMWEEAVAFWQRREYSFPAKHGLDQFFDFPEQELDAHLANLLGGFLSKKQPNAAGLLWGMPYVYEFLLHKEIVSGVLYRAILDRVASLKAKFIAAFPHYLWKYDFVHRWTHPDAVSTEELASETALFADSFRRVILLDDPPAREYYDCEEPEAPSPFPAWDFAPQAGSGSPSGYHYASGATKKKFKPQKKNKQKPKKKK